MNRREFIRTLSAGVVVTGAALAGCTPEHKRNGDTAQAALGEIPTDKMTYRTGKRGERVSLLGYGCMRWPTVAGLSAREATGDIDQAMSPTGTHWTPLDC